MIKTTTRICVSLSAALLSCVFIGGCRPGEPSPSVAPIVTPQGFTVRTLGHSAEGRPIDLYSAGGGAETIFIFAGIHGDEQAGISLVYKLMERLRHREGLMAGRRILVVSNANPDGVMRNTRGNARGVDLNRNFPADNRENTALFGYYGLSEPESRILYDLIKSTKPTRIVSIHQPLKCIDYDGPAEGLAHFMAMYCPLPVRKLGARPGSFGSFAGEKLGIPVITLELERADDNLTAEQLWGRYGTSLLAAITYPKSPY